MDQTNHNAQTDQDCEHDRHIDQHDDKRIRRYRLSHSLSPRLLPRASTPQWGFSFRDSPQDHRVLLLLTLFLFERRIPRSPELFRGYTCFLQNTPHTPHKCPAASHRLSARIWISPQRRTPSEPERKVILYTKGVSNTAQFFIKRKNERKIISLWNFADKYQKRIYSG